MLITGTVPIESKHVYLGVPDKYNSEDIDSELLADFDENEYESEKPLYRDCGKLFKLTEKALSNLLNTEEFKRNPILLENKPVYIKEPNVTF